MIGPRFHLNYALSFLNRFVKNLIVYLLLNVEFLSATQPHFSDEFERQYHKGTCHCITWLKLCGQFRFKYDYEREIVYDKRA